MNIQNYLRTVKIDNIDEERKVIFQLRTRMNYNIKNNFRNMHKDTVCEGCNVEKSKHTKECKELLGGNELVTYMPLYEDLFGTDKKEQVYIARIISDNLRRIRYLWKRFD